jgi:ankyrin repeat protein
MNQVNNIFNCLNGYLSPRRTLTQTSVASDPELEERVESVRMDSFNSFVNNGLEYSLPVIDRRGKALLRASRDRDEESLVRLLGSGPIFDEHLEQVMGEAVENNQRALVKRLLENGQISDEYLRVMMIKAVGSGYLEIVKLFLLTGRISFEYLNRSIKNPVESGDLEIMKLLLAEEISYAIEEGYADALEWLLSTQQISDRGLPGPVLEWAAEEGYLVIVKLLLATHQISHQSLGMAMIRAAQKGYTDIVELLLETHRISDARHLGSLLAWAAESGYLNIVKLLLATQRISNQSLGTAMVQAAEEGYSEIVKLLLATQRISDEHIGKAINKAAEKDHVHIMKLLSETGRGFDWISCAYLQLAMRCAVQRHSIDVMRLLLTIHRISDEHINNAMNTAVADGHLAIMGLLLETGRVSNKLIGDTMTRAVEYGHLNLVELLLATHRISDEYIRSAMTQAVEYGHLNIVELLLATHRISDEYIGSAMTRAAEYGRLNIVELLLATHRISDEYIGKAINMAAEGNHLDIMRLLLETDWRASHRLFDKYLGLAMRDAAQRNSIAVMRLLLETGRISDEHVNNAMGAAVECGHLDIMRLLLETGRVSNECLENIIDWSAKFGFLTIMRWLLAQGLVSDEVRRSAIDAAALYGQSAMVRLLRGESDLNRNLGLEIFSWFQLFDRAFPDEDPQIPETSKKGEFDNVVSKLINSLNEEEALLILNYLRKDPDDLSATSLRTTEEFTADGQSRASLALRVIRMIFLASEDDSFRRSMFECIAAGRGACGDRLLWSFNDIEVEGNLCRCRKLGDQAFAEMAARAQRYELVKQKGEKLANDLGNESEAVETVLYLFIHLSDPLNLPISTKHMAHPGCSQMNGDYVSQVQTELEAIKTVDLLAQSEPWRQYLKMKYPSAKKKLESLETIYGNQIDRLDPDTLNSDQYNKAVKQIATNRERRLSMITKEWTMKLQKKQGLLLN